MPNCPKVRNYNPDDYDGPYYDRILSAYRRHIPSSRLRMNVVKRLVNPDPADKVFDIGCAVGTLSDFMATYGADVTGFESQTGVGLLALAISKSMIVTDVVGLPDLVDSHEFIVPPNDRRSPARAIAKSLQDHKCLEKRELDSRRKARAFAWPNIARRTVALYRSILSA